MIFLSQINDKLNKDGFYVQENFISSEEIEKIKLDEVKVSSRISPYIKFEQEKQLYRMAFEVDGLSKSYDKQT